MLKVLAGAIKHPVNRTREEFHRYWQERHGPLFRHTPELRRYVQHHSLPEASTSTVTPTLHGASMFWYDDLDVLRSTQPSPLLRDAIGPDEPDLHAWYVASSRYGPPDQMTLRDTVMADDRNCSTARLSGRWTPNVPASWRKSGSSSTGRQRRRWSKSSGHSRASRD